MDPVLFEKLNSFLKCDLNDWGFNLEGFERELLVDRCDFILETSLKSLEDRHEEITHKIKELMEILFDSHFNIEPCELTHVSMSKSVFCSENWSNFEDSFEITLNAHLLVKLRGLS